MFYGVSCRMWIFWVASALSGRSRTSDISGFYRHWLCPIGVYVSEG